MSRARYESAARAAARRHGVPEEGFLALITQESGWNPTVRSPAGALGIAQFMPGTARGLGINPLNPVQALNASAKHLADLRRNFGSWRLALAGYNAGGGAVRKYRGVPPFPETQAYVAELLPAFNQAPTRPPAAAAAAARPPARGTGGGGSVPVPARVGGLDLAAVQRLMGEQSRRVLAGEGPSDDYVNRVLALIGQAKTNTALNRTGERVRQVAAPVAPAPVAPGGVVPILPGEPNWGSYGLAGDKEGQGGRHLAVDWFAPAGTPFRSPVTGRVVRMTPDPTPGRRASGQVFGGTIAVRDDQGRLFVMRHSVPTVRVGARVVAGQPLGTVKDWGPSSHIHFETYRAGSSDREYGAQYAINPRDLYRTPPARRSRA